MIFVLLLFLTFSDINGLTNLLRFQFFLQTISFYELHPSTLTESLLDFIKYSFVSQIQINNTSNTNILEITTELNSMKDKIKKFSNLFCLSSIQTQLVHKYIFSDDNKNENPFINYICREEKCRIDVSTYCFEKINDPLHAPCTCDLC